MLCAVGVYALVRAGGDRQQAATTPENPPVRAQAPPPQPNPQKPAPETKPPEPDAGSLAASALGSGPSGADIHKHVLKSVAWILALRDRQTGRGASGSGTLVDKEHRLVLTNHHVINQEQDLVIFFPKYRDGQLVVSKEDYIKQIQQEGVKNVIHGRVVAQDQGCDLALIQLDSVPEEIEALALANKSADYGETVHSVGITGASGGLWGYTPGQVRVRAYEKSWKDQGGEHRAKMVEATNPTNPGDSGGPLVNGRGELVAVTQAGLVGAQAINQFVDVSHAITMIETYCREQNFAWKRETRSLRVGSNPNDIMVLVKSLDDSDNNVRARASQALGNIGAEAKLAVPALLKRLKNEQNDVTRGVLADALAKIGPPAKQDVGLLREAITDLNPKVRAYAADSIGALGPDAESLLALLTEAASDQDVQVRQNAVRSLGKMGGNGKDTIVPALTTALKDSEHEVRVAAAKALEGMDTLGATDVALLTSMLKQQDSEVRASGARALGKMGPKAKAALPELMEAFKGSDKAVRRAAIGALVGLGAEAKSAVPAFTDALGDSDAEVRKQATVALAKLGPDAQPAAEALANVLSDSDKEVRKNAVKALAKIADGSKPVVSALAQALKDEDKDLRMEVADALAAIGPPAKAAVPNLIACLEDLGSKDKLKRDKIGTGLGKIGKDKDSITLLINALASPNPSVRSGSCIALGEIGPPAKKAAVSLAALASNDGIIEVRDAARTAYSKVTAKP
ncbi:MAG TPA: HEAT repeat domain-containing protein [Gemmataceae bacterium]